MKEGKNPLLLKPAFMLFTLHELAVQLCDGPGGELNTIHADAAARAAGVVIDVIPRPSSLLYDEGLEDVPPDLNLQRLLSLGMDKERPMKVINAVSRVAHREHLLDGQLTAIISSWAEVRLETEVFTRSGASSPEARGGA